MKLSAKRKNGQLTLLFIGELDHHAARTAMQDIDREIDQSLPRDCIIDLSGLTFMDSSGIAVLLKTYKRMQEAGGRMWVENVPPQPL